MKNQDFDIWAYGRVSTDEQANDKDALLKQLERLRNSGATKIFFDVDKRTKSNRRGLLKLIQAVQDLPLTHKVKFLHFTRIDRVAALQSIFYELVRELKKKNIKPISLDDPFDLDSIGGELTVDIRLAAAKYEVNMVGLRVKKDRETRRQQKKANYFPPFGYKIINDKYVLNADPCICLIDTKMELNVAEVGKLVIEVFYKIGSCTQTAKKLNEMFGVSSPSAGLKSRKLGDYLIGEKDNINQGTLRKKIDEKTNQGLRYPHCGLRWSATGVRDWLTNPVLAGGTPYDTCKENGNKKSYNDIKVFWNTHDNETLISFQQHQEIKCIIQGNRNNSWATHNSDPNKINIFQGLIVCAYCNSNFVKTCTYKPKNGKLKFYYQCAYFQKTGMCNHKKMITETILEDQIVDFLIKACKELSALGEEINLTSVENKRLIELRLQLQTLESIPGYNIAIETAKENLRTQIREVSLIDQPLTRQLISKERIIAAFKDRDFWTSIQQPLDKKKLLNACIINAVVKEGQVVEVRLKV